jgi:hypothetical protein
MKRQRRTIGPVITGAAGLTLLYMFSIIFDLWLVLILALYLSATMATLWMAYRILKDPCSTNKTFDEYFYQDRDDIRRSGTE